MIAAPLHPLFHRWSSAGTANVRMSHCDLPDRMYVADTDPSRLAGQHRSGKAYLPSVIPKQYSSIGTVTVLGQ